jgi:hypothetical protein
MRCEDCLPLVEEYFDGEVEETTAARMGAHLSACATCAAALDALSFEQEIYARYDRGGLEVAPDLWSRVSAEIAREPLPESPARPRPFLSGVRQRLAAALGTLAARPALASSLALLIVGVAVGSLWLSRRTQPPPVAANDVARSEPAVTPVVPPAVNPQVLDGGGGGEVPALKGSDSLNGNAGEAVPAAHETAGLGPREGADRLRTVEIAPGSVREDDLAALLATPSTPPASAAGTVNLLPEEHAVAEDETAALIVNASAVSGQSAAVAARPLDPAQKEMARHVEQTQMLLRSFKNARASETGSVDVAYEKNLSRKLLAQNATLQLEAEVKGDRETKQVLDTIEPFLLDIANLRENPSRDEVRSIRERVRNNEIVAALQVY